MSVKSLMAIGLAVGVFGCASTSPAILQALASAGPIPAVVECSGDVQCKEQWERAQFWVSKHSKLKVQVSTDVMVSTYNPGDNEVTYGFTVTKEPMGSGRYRFAVAMHCGNPLGCSPKEVDVDRAFSLYVATGKDALDGVSLTGQSVRVP